MATARLKFRASSYETKEGILFFQVIHNRVARQIRTHYKLYPQEWDADKKEIVLPAGVGEERRNYLISLKKELREDMRRLKSIISRFESEGDGYTVEDVASAYILPTDNSCFISFARGLVGQLKLIGKRCTADTYTTAVNSFARFRKGCDILWEDVNSDLLMAYEVYLKSTGICPNSISFYMRNLRAIYNRAVEKDLTVQRHPFKHVYTGIDKTVKRAVPLKIIRQIRDLDLTLYPAVDFARDVFMFSFYTRGMSFVDMAFLKKKDLRNGILSYRRQKTGQRLTIKWEKPMQEIIDKYDIADTPYLLPIIRNIDVDARRQYKTKAHLVNDKLRKLGERLGLTIPLTTYVARHGWASIARSKNIPLSIISEAMGHDSEKTTRIYLASLDTSAVDKANKQIIKAL